MRFSALSRWWIGVYALGLVLGGVSTAAAQPQPVPPTYGFYYKEIRKDDRIYVFNNRRRGGAIRGLRRDGPGASPSPASGPNGETVVGDSERALQLFYFKHGLSEAVPDPIAADPAHRVGATARPGSRPTSPTSRSRTACRSRYTHEFPADDGHAAGHGGARAIRSGRSGSAARS